MTFSDQALRPESYGVLAAFLLCLFDLEANTNFQTAVEYFQGLDILKSKENRPADGTTCFHAAGIYPEVHFVNLFFSSESLLKLRSSQFWEKS